VGLSPYIAAVREKLGTDLLFIPAAGMAVFDDEGRLLLARHAEGNRWTTPGGAIEPGESPREAAIRELLEETGLHGDECELFGAYGGPEFEIIYRDGNRVAYVSIMYGCRQVRGELRLQADELREVRWMSEAEAMDLPLPGTTRVILPDAYEWWRATHRRTAGTSDQPTEDARTRSVTPFTATEPD
jgi:8-oxo-dGTP pyrophosphatase MutT (NUDIX family)